ncbi:MAG: hypothetical protein M1268_02270 [Patescibacteria group bacterium]|nr:hypothetical protein [Patescibacteria group bacterium]
MSIAEQPNLKGSFEAARPTAIQKERSLEVLSFCRELEQKGLCIIVEGDHEYCRQMTGKIGTNGKQETILTGGIFLPGELTDETTRTVIFRKIFDF